VAALSSPPRNRIFPTFEKVFLIALPGRLVMSILSAGLPRSCFCSSLKSSARAVVDSFHDALSHSSSASCRSCRSKPDRSQ